MAYLFTSRPTEGRSLPHNYGYLFSYFGTQFHHTTAYHSQSNGLVERLHRHLKSALRARLTSPSWTQELPRVLLGIRTVPKEDLGCSSAEMVYGSPLTVPGDFISSSVSTSSQPASHLCQLRDQVWSLAPIPTSQHFSLHTKFPDNLNRPSSLSFVATHTGLLFSALMKALSKLFSRVSNPFRLTLEEKVKLSPLTV